MKRWRLLGFALAGAFLAQLAAAQGLGEAAAKEKRRREEERKKAGSTKVLTNDDLAKAGAAGEPVATGAPAAAPAAGAARPQAPPGDTSRSESDADYETTPDGRVRRRVRAGEQSASDERTGPDEAEWRQSIKEVRQAIEQAEARVRRLDERAGEIFGALQRTTDTNEMLRLQAEQRGVTQELETAKAALGAARSAWTALEEEARRAGVPPGWLR